MGENGSVEAVLTARMANPAEADGEVTANEIGEAVGSEYVPARAGELTYFRTR